MKQLTEKQKAIRLGIILILCLAAGVALGMAIVAISGMDGWEPASLVQAHARALSIGLTVVFALINIGGQAWGWAGTARCRTQASCLTMDDEEQLDALESRLGKPMVVSSVGMIVNMALFPLIAELLMQETVEKTLAGVLLAVTVAIFLGALVAGFAMNKVCVDLEKKLNPEKRGSLMDISFQKTWMASCDEAQQKIIHEAGFRAFRAGSSACSVLWLVTIVLNMLLKTGVGATLAVCAIWLVLQVSYFSAAERLERSGR